MDYLRSIAFLSNTQLLGTFTDEAYALCITILLSSPYSR